MTPRQGTTGFSFPNSSELDLGAAVPDYEDRRATSDSWCRLLQGRPVPPLFEVKSHPGSIALLA